ncbi:hypothetical protein K435DRAFT_676614 [Dendrothele bispora CBS 962.96]|uniref:Uncharacterized protein n=1 Tax=Dendrothele bispora (strain CBS 962.96) TaxID=1314807 RepID=A0A4S8LLA8_DENBC|nr:hypothetical protein K435DRAFT_676614 [Dendrothele bispora CBS 962.96]
MVPVTLAQVALSLSTTRGLLMSQILSFILYCNRLKRYILMIHPSNHQPRITPKDIPLETRTFLQKSCSMDNDDVEACWDAVKDVVWQEDPILAQVKDEASLQSVFSQHGGSLFRAFKLFSSLLITNMF